MLIETIDDIEEYIRIELFKVFIFSERFESIINNDVEYNKNMLSELDEKIAIIDDSNYKNMKVRDTLLLKESNPELFNKINNDYGLKFKKILIESNISNSESYFIEFGLNATFLISYSIFEDCIKRICDFCSKKKNIKIYWSDLKGSTLEAIKKYLIKIIEIDINFATISEWERIISYQKIRNHFAHSNNIVDNDCKIVSIINNMDTNITIDYNRIVINETFIQNSLIIYEDFFKQLLDKIKENFKNKDT